MSASTPVVFPNGNYGESVRMEHEYKVAPSPEPITLSLSPDNLANGKCGDPISVTAVMTDCLRPSAPKVTVTLTSPLDGVCIPEFWRVDLKGTPGAIILRENHHSRSQYSGDLSSVSVHHFSPVVSYLTEGEYVDQTCVPKTNNGLLMHPIRSIHEYGLRHSGFVFIVGTSHSLGTDHGPTDIQVVHGSGTLEILDIDDEVEESIELGPKINVEVSPGDRYRIRNDGRNTELVARLTEYTREVGRVEQADVAERGGVVRN